MDSKQETQPAPAKLSRQNSWRAFPNNRLWTLVDEWWLWELLSWSFAALCMIAMVVLLGIYRGRTIPDWPLGLTINAYISILGAFIKAALLLPTAVSSLTIISVFLQLICSTLQEALGQLKFNWFAVSSRNVSDFQAFDEASRGPWGSLVLILRTKGR